MERVNTTYHFSNSSESELVTCDKRLQLVAYRAIDIIDFTVLEGRRSQQRQNKLYTQGKSKLQWPNSNHNVEDPDDLAKAYDLAPYPIDWAKMPDLDTDTPIRKLKKELNKWAINLSRFYYLGGVIKTVAHEVGVPIRWGGDWDGDNDFHDQTFNDLVHFEIDEQ